MHLSQWFTFQYAGIWQSKVHLLCKVGLFDLLSVLCALPKQHK